MSPSGFTVPHQNQRSEQHFFIFFSKVAAAPPFITPPCAACIINNRKHTALYFLVTRCFVRKRNPLEIQTGIRLHVGFLTVSLQAGQIKLLIILFHCNYFVFSNLSLSLCFVSQRNSPMSWRSATLSSPACSPWRWSSNLQHLAPSATWETPTMSLTELLSL